MTLTIDAVPDFTGDVVLPDSAAYDSAREVFNGLIDKRPSVVLRCRSRADIVAAIRYAVSSGAELAVRCSGHSVAGHSSTDGGIVIDLSLMRGVVVDPEHRIVVVEPGATRKLSYPTWQQVLDHTAAFGRLNYWKSVFLTELSDEAIRRIVLLGRTRPAPQTRLPVIGLGGFSSRVPPQATAFSARDHPYIVHLITTWTDPADTQRCTSWTNDAYETLRPLGPASAYLNFVGDEGQARIRASFGEVTYRRLARLKARLDPDNRFALNQNIEPATHT